MADKQRLSYRCLNGQWEVLLDGPEEWKEVDSEEDAKLIANARKLATEVDDGCKHGTDVAHILETSADLLDKYLCGTSMGARYFRRIATKARKHS